MEEQIKKWLRPIWEGEEMAEEPVCVIRNLCKEIAPFRLAYPIVRILSVTSADGTVRYEEGRDYRLNAFGELEIVRGGRVPFLPWENFRLNAFDPSRADNIASADGLGGQYLGELFADAEGMRAYVLNVSYLHEESGKYDIVPGKRGLFPNLFQKAKQGIVRLASFGDSITYGWAASGMRDIRRAPFCPPYAELFAEGLKERLCTEVVHENFSVSGMCTDWAEKNLRPVVQFRPDLVLFAFGMNDAGVFRPEDFEQRTRRILSAIRAEVPAVEFLLISPLLPNPAAAFTAGVSIKRYHEEYPRAFEALEQSEHVAYANVTAMHRLLLERKNLQDTLSNNVNHPNDFMHRVYAQVALKTVTQ